jgi:hypothetical protein
MTTNRWFPILATLVTIACTGAAQAGEKIRYQDLRKQLTHFTDTLANRGFDVVTLDGKQHRGRTLFLGADHVRIFHSEKAWDDLPSGQIVRIEISQRGRFFHHIPESATYPLWGAYAVCGNINSNVVIWLCAVPATAVFSPLWAYTAVTAPFYLAADGVTFVIPPKVYEIVQ